MLGDGGTRHWSKLTRARDDAGMTLTEVMVAILILGIIAGAIAAVLIQSLKSMKSSGDYQTATQLVNTRIEELRAMSADTVAGGVSTSQVATAVGNGQETRLTGSGPYTFNGETLLTQASPPADTPLNPYRTTATVDNVTYTLTTYTTRCWQPKATPGTCGAAVNPATDAPMVRATVVVTWPGSGTQVRSTQQQTIIYPKGAAPVLYRGDPVGSGETEVLALVTGFGI